MIEDFVFFNSEVSIPISIEYPINLEERATKDKVDKYVNGRSNYGISWEHNGSKIVLKDSSGSIKGFPSTDLNFIITIHHGSESKYQPPNNAVIYNLDGTVYKVLDMPELLSPIITKRLKYLSLPNPPIKWSTNEGGLKFDGFMWKRNKSGELVDAISILFDREIWESRILNVKLGKIGECLDYGIA
ncbi:MAG: hypothetical protein ACK47E_04540 [Cyclobacteriaceae bacterium]|jgi:hypothetical protein